MDSFVEALVKQLPPGYVLWIVVGFALLLLAYFLWEARKNREVKLLWGAITLGPRVPGFDREIFDKSIKCVESLREEVQTLRSEQFARLEQLRADEAQMRDKLHDPFISSDLQRRVEQSIEKSRQDRQRLEQTIVDRLDAIEKQIKDVIDSWKARNNS